MNNYISGLIANHKLRIDINSIFKKFSKKQMEIGNLVL